jgi:hypothetical protein
MSEGTDHAFAARSYESLDFSSRYVEQKGRHDANRHHAAGKQVQQRRGQLEIRRKSAVAPLRT